MQAPTLRLVCPYCHESFVLLHDHVSLRFQRTEPVSYLYTICGECEEDLRFALPTPLAIWLAWAGMPLRDYIDRDEVDAYMHTLQDEHTFQEELDIFLGDE